MVGDVRRTANRARSLALLLAVPLVVDGDGLMHVKWEGLTVVVGKTVSIAMPGGAVITGKATGVESDALVVDVKKSSDRSAYPKGVVRVPRAMLHRLEMQAKGKVGRIVGTTVGGVVGFAGGVGAAFGIQGGLFGNKHDAAAGIGRAHV